MEDLKYYAERVECCINIADICFGRYNETKEKRWERLGNEWLKSLKDWEELAREDGVYLV